MVSALRFNRVCRISALAWLLGVTVGGLLFRPTHQDFSAFYMGGLAARSGAWDALYPTPSPGSPYYIARDGTMKPWFVHTAQSLKVQALCPFLQSPPAALLFAPLSLLPFEPAHWLWLIVLALACWGVAIQAGRIYALCAGEVSRAEGWVTLLVAFSPLAYRSMRVGNVSPVVAFCLGAAVICLLAPRPVAGGISLLLGGLMKYATVMLLPLALAMRRVSLVLWCAGLGGLIFLIVWLLAGTGPFVEFFTVVLPSMSGSTANPGNQSLQAFLLRLLDRTALPFSWAVIFQTIQITILAFILGLFIRRGRGLWNEKANVFAAAVALIAWLLIFSPVCWEHYHLYFAPFWGWLVYEARRSILYRMAGGLAVLLAYVPLSVIPSFHAPEPLNSHMLGSAILLLALAMLRLVAPSGHPSGCHR